MSKTDTGAGVIDAMRTLLGDSEKLSGTLMNQAQTLPTVEVMERINFIVDDAAKAPPMPEDPEHIAALRDRAALYARMVYGSVLITPSAKKTPVKDCGTLLDHRYRSTGKNIPLIVEIAGGFGILPCSTGSITTTRWIGDSMLKWRTSCFRRCPSHQI